MADKQTDDDRPADEQAGSAGDDQKPAENPAESADGDEAPAERQAGEPASQDEPPGGGDAGATTAGGHEPAGPGPAAAPVPRPSRLPAAIATLALLLAIAAGAGVGLLWFDRESGPDPAVADLRQALERAGARVDKLAGTLERARRELDDLKGAGSGAEREIESLRRALEQRLQTLEALPGRLASIESSLAALQGISSGLRDTWLLAEAEYYLQIGNAQLELAGNAELARIALQLADERLASLGNPALTGVRRAIADELRGLEAVTDVDAEANALPLASLADAVESLPIRNDVVEPEFDDPAVAGDLSGIDRAWASLKSSLSDVISVRRSDAPVKPLLPPDAAYFLRSNVTLQLQAARLALLQGEEALYLQSLDDAAAWLREYFDTDTRPVQSALDTLDELRDARLDTVRPDISGSLALLRQFAASRGNPQRMPDASAGDGPAQ